MALPALLRARGVARADRLLPAHPVPLAGHAGQVPEAAALVRDLLVCRPARVPDRERRRQLRRGRGRLGRRRARPGRLAAASTGRRIRLGVFPVEIEPREFAAIAEDVLARLARRTAPPQPDGSNRSSSAWTGWTRPRACCSASPATAACSRRGRTGSAGSRCCRSPPNRARTSSPTASCARRSSARPAASTARFGEPDWTPLRLIARAGAAQHGRRLHARGAGRPGDAAAGRHEPRRQGIHRRPGPAGSGRAGAVPLRRRRRQLGSALLVNPYDADEMADALDRR